MVLLLALSASAASPTREAMTAAEFKQIATRQHDATGTVIIYRALVDGMPCFKGSATSGPLDRDAVLDVLFDVESAVDWSSAGITVGTTLKRNTNSLDFYQYLDIPNWTMVADRYWLLHAGHTPEEGRIEFWWDHLAEDGPYAGTRASYHAAHPEAVEPPINIGAWIFEFNGTTTDVVYQVCTDPGGALPQWIQNIATKRTLPDTVGEFIAEAERRGS